MSQAMKIRIGTKGSESYTTVTMDTPVFPVTPVSTPSKLEISKERWMQQCKTFQKTFIRCTIQLAVSIAITGIIDFATFGSLTSFLLESYHMVHLVVMESHHLLEYIGIQVDLSAFKFLTNRSFPM